MRRANAILLSGKNILLLHLTFYKLLKSLSQSHCAHSLYKTRFWAVYSYSPYLNLTWECFRCLYHVQLQNVWFCDVLMRPVSSGPRLRFHFRWGGAFTRREEATRPARKKKEKKEELYYKLHDWFCYFLSLWKTAPSAILTPQRNIEYLAVR